MRGKALRVTITTIVLILFTAVPAFAGKGGNGNAGAAGGHYSGTLTATPSVLHAGDHFTVSGCGYDTARGNVIVGFTGGSWGSPLDSNGCFSIPDVPALSGDTLSPGSYEVHAYQFVHNKWTETGETTVTVVR